MHRRSTQLLLVSLAGFGSMGAMCGWGAPLEGLATHCPPKTIDCGPGCIEEGTTCCDDTPTGGMSQCPAAADGGAGLACTRSGDGSCPASGAGKYCCGEAGAYRPSTDVGAVTFNGVSGVFCGAQVIASGSECCASVEAKKLCRYTSPRGDSSGTGGGGVGGGTGGTGGTGTGGGGGSPPPCSISVSGQCASSTFCYVTSSTVAPSGVCLGGCDVVTQNCAGSTSQCTYSNGVRGCYPNGTVPERGDCRVSSCARGTACVSNQLMLDGGTGSVCAKYCRTNTECSSPRQCNTAVTFGSSTERPRVCLSCNLLTQNCTTTSQGCYHATSGISCLAPGTKAIGQVCTFASECVKGSVCLGATGVCRKYCSTAGGAPSCTTGTCNQLPGVAAGVGGCF